MGGSGEDARILHREHGENEAGEDKARDSEDCHGCSVSEEGTGSFNLTGFILLELQGEEPQNAHSTREARDGVPILLQEDLPSNGERVSGLQQAGADRSLSPDPEGPRLNGYSWLGRKAPSPLRSPGLPPSLITP